ncbi:hypothetical protein CONCODRAFT_77183 [Conidiobolus coronatus NRRL 28638]|uniref:Uncharacterized protein n=1 Tax=Conidiobolus coronatus (strain ATCC 28846 / CBS 209.66 / NRRL 28638) TaxID=796925 RepID=A0A137PFN4_CONC2|nr:hypothetical protein CONCODRAFT_77183 [Conidiobolus coronatus NRRL 28638]|eukprot:KXN73804.1 hypothetical protein CONCODRAFT_77183 [Conidiobolus coronatus NRRL 28638]
MSVNQNPHSDRIIQDAFLPTINSLFILMEQHRVEHVIATRESVVIVRYNSAPIVVPKQDLNTGHNFNMNQMHNNPNTTPGNNVIMNHQQQNLIANPHHPHQHHPHPHQMQHAHQSQHPQLPYGFPPDSLHHPQNPSSFSYASSLPPFPPPDNHPHSSANANPKLPGHPSLPTPINSMLMPSNNTANPVSNPAAAPAASGNNSNQTSAKKPRPSTAKFTSTPSIAPTSLTNNGNANANGNANGNGNSNGNSADANYNGGANLGQPPAKKSRAMYIPPATQQPVPANCQVLVDNLRNATSSLTHNRNTFPPFSYDANNPNPEFPIDTVVPYLQIMPKFTQTIITSFLAAITKSYRRPIPQISYPWKNLDWPTQLEMLLVSLEEMRMSSAPKLQYTQQLHNMNLFNMSGFHYLNVILHNLIKQHTGSPDFASTLSAIQNRVGKRGNKQVHFCHRIGYLYHGLPAEYAYSQDFCKNWFFKVQNLQLVQLRICLEWDITNNFLK